MNKISSLFYSKIKKKRAGEKVIEPITKEDLAQLEAKIDRLIMVLTPRQKLRLLKALVRKKG